MSHEEVISSTQNTDPAPMDTVEENEVDSTQYIQPLTNGLQNGSNAQASDDRERARVLLDGECGENLEEVLNTTQHIINSVKCTPVPQYVIQAAHYMTDFVVRKHAAVRGISILEDLLAKIQEDGVLSSVHSDFVQLCLASKILSPALRYLDVDITSVASHEGDALDVRHVLQYHYYGGAIYAALRNFRRAFHMFEICLCVPSQQTTSAIQVEAYQKYLLVSILCGQKTTQRVSVSINIPYLCRPYLNLILIARDKDADKFAATIAQMTPFLEKHSNLGLAKQTLEYLRRKNIEELQNTFISLKLDTLATHLKLPMWDVEKRLREMIMSGQLSAQICNKEGVVWFNKVEDQLDDVAAISTLTSSLQSCINTYSQMKELSTSLSLDPKLLAKITESEERGKKTEATSTTWNFPVKGSKKSVAFLE